MGIRPGLSPANAPAATGPAGRLVSSIGHRGSLDPSPGGWFTAPLDVLSVVLKLAGANVALAGLDRGVARRVQRRAVASSWPAATPRSDASRSSTGWSAGSGRPARRSSALTWTRQPGLAAA